MIDNSMQEMDLSRSFVLDDFTVYSGLVTGMAEEGISAAYNAIVVMDAYIPNADGSAIHVGEVNVALTAHQAGDLVLSLVGVAWQNSTKDSRYGWQFIQGFVTALAYANEHGDGAGSQAFEWMGEQSLAYMRQMKAEMNAEQQAAETGPESAADGREPATATNHTDDAPEAQQ